MLYELQALSTRRTLRFHYVGFVLYSFIINHYSFSHTIIKNLKDHLLLVLFVFFLEITCYSVLLSDFWFRFQVVCCCCWLNSYVIFLPLAGSLRALWEAISSSECRTDVQLVWSRYRPAAILGSKLQSLWNDHLHQVVCNCKSMNFVNSCLVKHNLGLTFVFLVSECMCKLELFSVNSCCQGS